MYQKTFRDGDFTRNEKDKIQDFEKYEKYENCVKERGSVMRRRWQGVWLKTIHFENFGVYMIVLLLLCMYYCTY